MGNVRVEINGMALGTRPYVRLVNPQCAVNSRSVQPSDIDTKETGITYY